MMMWKEKDGMDRMSRGWMDGCLMRMMDERTDGAVGRLMAIDEEING